MKQRSLLIITVFFSVCLLIFACRRDINNMINDRTATSSALLESAKIWYLKQTVNNDSKLVPNWKYSWTLKSINGENLLIVPAPELTNQRTELLSKFPLHTPTTLPLKQQEAQNGKIVKGRGGSRGLLHP